MKLSKDKVLMFCLNKIHLGCVGYMIHTLNISTKFLCLKTDMNFPFSLYVQTNIANVDFFYNRSLHYPYLRSVI